MTQMNGQKQALLFKTYAIIFFYVKEWSDITSTERTTLKFAYNTWF